MRLRWGEGLPGQVLESHVSNKDLVPSNRRPSLVQGGWGGGRAWPVAGGLFLFLQGAEAPWQVRGRLS